MSNPITHPSMSLASPMKIGAALMVLTSVHHAYGAYIYAAPFRLHVAAIAVPVIGVLLGCAHLATNGQSRLSRRIAVAAGVTTLVAVPLLFVGLYEGLYNHIFKDIVYAFGLFPDLRTTLFPAGLYEPPTDLFFEVTGILQFAVSLAGIAQLWRYIRAVRGRTTIAQQAS